MLPFQEIQQKKKIHNFAKLLIDELLINSIFTYLVIFGPHLSFLWAVSIVKMKEKGLNIHLQLNRTVRQTRGKIEENFKLFATITKPRNSLSFSRKPITPINMYFWKKTIQKCV